MAEIQKAICHWLIEFSILSKWPVVFGARKPVILPHVFVMPIMIPAYDGAKSNIEVLHPAVVNLLKPSDTTKKRIAHSAAQPMYPARTMVTAGTRSPRAVKSFRTPTVVIQPCQRMKSASQPVKIVTKVWRMYGRLDKSPLVLMSKLKKG